MSMWNLFWLEQSKATNELLNQEQQKDPLHQEDTKKSSHQWQRWKQSQFQVKTTSAQDWFKVQADQSLEADYVFFTNQ